MRDDQASFTARIVALARALATDADGPLDPTASAMLGAPWLEGARGPFASGLPRRALSVLSARVFDHVALRTRRIDDAVAEACVNAKQLVILGAGLDGRAWRLDALHDVTLFEVDHPATQRFKRGRVANLSPKAREVRFVCVDFERDSLLEELLAAGFDPEEPAAWIWEGVTMYLEPSTVRGSLAILGELSATGSTLIVTYATRNSLLFRFGLERVVDTAFGILGEPLPGLTTRADFGALVARAGWTPTSDEGDDEMRRRYPGWQRAPWEERVMVCTR